ncbi:hypothetical protein KSF_107780 [Reticulibacter mediterranei]|uniref:Uncharacterized protein n=1 Tax=Reticulibacter mediterranei TaxID=2778369 RepID=A0A8J3IYC1_9CHLR|nr:hypothetical protein [Reticulibacter mediterranei]GHP00731.1 hypothetical protein KSF_107780 [Reticulibacter mediterranei]
MDNGCCSQQEKNLRQQQTQLQKRLERLNLINPSLGDAVTVVRLVATLKNIEQLLENPSVVEVEQKAPLIRAPIPPEVQLQAQHQEIVYKVVRLAEGNKLVSINELEQWEVEYIPHITTKPPVAQSLFFVYLGEEAAKRYYASWVREGGKRVITTYQLWRCCTPKIQHIPYRPDEMDAYKWATFWEIIAREGALYPTAVWDLCPVAADVGICEDVTLIEQIA